MIVIYADIKACQFCSKGARAWFSQYKLDYLHFVGNGIDADVLLATKDPFAIRAVEQAKKRLKGVE
ncbi:MAG: hypothetical protein BGO19_02325 [Acinetobacter sp. 38-8]|nr:MAG: hypothetical protein BGO19_02325 [Acinetobacter sp. 38-8]